MIFKGTVLSIAELLERSLADEGASLDHTVGLRHTAAGNALRVADLYRAGDSLNDLWRFGILQTLDDYTSTLRRGGVELAAEFFAAEPAETGAIEIDAAFAALADYLADRDGWTAPTWVDAPARILTSTWYASVPPIFHADADRQSPEAFRKRGILITDRSLARA